MLANVIVLEEAMCIDAIEHPDALAFCMEFEATFLSVEHGFLLDLFRLAGWPDWLLRYLWVVDHQTVSMIDFGGAIYDGLAAKRGVR